jgi:hypothetical protein
MKDVLQAYEKLFCDATLVADGPLSCIKRIISGGFENHKIDKSSLPAIQIMSTGNTLLESGIPCSYYSNQLEVRVVYNASSFLDDAPVTGSDNKIVRINATHALRDQVEKVTNCSYDPNCIVGVIMNNPILFLDGNPVGYNARVDSIEYGTFAR